MTNKTNYTTKQISIQLNLSEKCTVLIQLLIL